MVIPAPTDERYIIWDANTQRFRDLNTGRYVSNLEGVLSLRAEVWGDGIRFRDAAGHFAPDPAKLIYGGNVFKYGDIVRTWTSRGNEVYIEAPDPNAYYTSVVLYMDDNGNMRYVTTYHKIGMVLDPEDERRRIAASIAAQEGYDMGEKGSDSIIEMVLRILHFEAV